MTEDPVVASTREAQLIRLRTSDSVELAADLVVAARPWAGAVVSHPHPAYGGDRHNAVVDRIFHTLSNAELTVLRFDFRHGGDGDAGEPHDVLAGIEQVAEHLGPRLPLWLIGYSFGADLALSVGDQRVAGWVAVAPPLCFGPPPRATTGDQRPVLIVAAHHDQVSPPERRREAAATWPDAAVIVMPDTDHLLIGATDQVANAILAWL